MGLYDRDYNQEHFRYKFGNMPQLRFGLPRLTQAVKCLLVVNVLIFFITVVLPRNLPVDVGGELIYLNFAEKWFSVFPFSIGFKAQIWRLITYQFLHGGRWHILFNMLVLYFLGPTLERHWGGKRFVGFYLGCGTAGGLFYTLLAGVGFLTAFPMVGASGSMLGLLAACAVLFPQFVVFIFFFPLPIRVAAIVLTGGYLFAVLTRSPNSGGDAAHLAGLIAGAGYVLFRPWYARIKMKARSGIWRRKVASRQGLQMEVDRILEKVHASGIASLTFRERKTLKRATKAEQQR